MRNRSGTFRGLEGRQLPPDDGTKPKIKPNDLLYVLPSVGHAYVSNYTTSQYAVPLLSVFLRFFSVANRNFAKMI